MPKIVKVYSPDELERQVHFIVREHQSPGLLKFLAGLPFGTEGAWWRGVAMLWLQQNADSPDFEARLNEALAATGATASTQAPRERRALIKTTPKTAATVSASAVARPIPADPHPMAIAVQAARTAPTTHLHPASLPAELKPEPVTSDDLDDKALALLDDFGSMAD